MKPQILVTLNFVYRPINKTTGSILYVYILDLYIVFIISGYSLTLMASITWKKLCITKMLVAHNCLCYWTNSETF